MTHQEFDRRLDEILVNFYNDVEPDVHATSGGIVYTSAGTKAKQAIDRLFLDAVGKDAYHFDEVFCHRFEPTREMIGANQLRQQLRTTITGKEGGDE